jgi:hypothetical protein
MGNICVVMRSTHDMRPADRMFDMPDIEYVFFDQNVFYTWKHSITFTSVKIILNKKKALGRFSVNDARLSSSNYKNFNFCR